MKRLLLLIITAGFLFASFSKDSPETTAENIMIIKAESKPEIFRGLSKLITSIAKVCAGSSKNQSSDPDSKTTCGNSNCQGLEPDFPADNQLNILLICNIPSNRLFSDEVHQV